jgi:hypothetical protein
MLDGFSIFYQFDFICVVVAPLGASRIVVCACREGYYGVDISLCFSGFHFATWGWMFGGGEGIFTK